MLQIDWRPRSVPLTPQAVVIPREQAGALCGRLAGSELTGVATPAALVLVGPEAALPWLPGARYFGRSEAAPELLLPTALEPTVPEPLLARGIRARASERGDPGSWAGPWLVIPKAKNGQPGQLIALELVAPVDREELEIWTRGSPG